MLRRIFGSKSDEMTAGWRILHNEELCDLYVPNFIRAIKSRRVGWVGNVARMGTGEVMERDPGVGRRIVLTF